MPMESKETMDAQTTPCKPPPPPPSGDVEFAKCDCCGLMEECTPAYVARVRERYGGRWICGLCGEAIKDESSRSQKNIGTTEAFELHMKFYQQFKSSTTPPANPTENLISALKNLLKRSLESPRKKKGSVFPSSASSSSSSSTSSLP